MQSLTALESPLTVPMAEVPPAGHPPAAPPAAAPPTPPAAPVPVWRGALQQSTVAIALTVFVLATLWIATLWIVDQSRRDALADARVSLTNLTRAFAEHTGKTLEGADQAVRFTRSEFLDKGAHFDLSSYLDRKAIIGKEYHLLTIIGADGYVTHSTQPFQRVDLRDREHFRVHAETTEDRLFISKPVLGRVSKKWSIQLTRRIAAPDGRFDGVVVLSLSPDYLTRFYADVDLGRHGAIALVGSDGVVRASASPGEETALRDISHSALFRQAVAKGTGTVRAVSPIDGIERDWAFRRLDPYGLVVLTGLGIDDVLADANELREQVLVAATGVTLVVIGFLVVVVRRAAQQLRLVRELQASRHEAQAASRAKTRFLASVSHELRTPLNGILGFAETIRDTSSDADSREFGGVIHRSASQLHGLVNNILDLVKIETGRMGVTPQPVAVADLLRRVHGTHAAAAQARGLRLWMAMQPGCPDGLVTDPQRVRQVLDALVGNALKFTPAGEISLIARGEGGGLVIEVADTGVGIAPQRLATVFDRFESGMGSFDHADQGAGLGLPLAFELSRLLGGELSLSSKPGEGTIATLRLPPQVAPRQPAATGESFDD